METDERSTSQLADGEAGPFDVAVASLAKMTPDEVRSLYGRTVARLFEIEGIPDEHPYAAIRRKAVDACVIFGSLIRYIEAIEKDEAGDVDLGALAGDARDVYEALEAALDATFPGRAVMRHFRAALDVAFPDGCCFVACRKTSESGGG